MNIGLLLPSGSERSIRDQIEIATMAERGEYDILLAGETWGRDAFTRLGAVAMQTETIELGTGIIPVHSRSPALIAQSIATVDELTDGRAVLGLGVSSKKVIEEWHGVQFKPALRRQRETIEIVRRVLSGDAVDYDGTVFDLEEFRLRFEPPRESVPIYVAAQGETNCQLVGEFADGWMPNRIPVSDLDSLREHVDTGASKQGRDPEAIDTVPYVTTCVLDDGVRAKSRCREMIAFYVGAMGDHHFNALAQHGYREEAETIREHWQNDDREGAQAAVTDAVLEEIAIAGTPDEAAEILSTYREVADSVIVLLAKTATFEEMKETVRNIAEIKERIGM